MKCMLLPGGWPYYYYGTHILLTNKEATIFLLFVWKKKTPTDVLPWVRCYSTSCTACFCCLINSQHGRDVRRTGSRELKLWFLFCIASPLLSYPLLALLSSPEYSLPGYWGPGFFHPASQKPYRLSIKLHLLDIADHSRLLSAHSYISSCATQAVFFSSAGLRSNWSLAHNYSYDPCGPQADSS